MEMIRHGNENMLIAERLGEILIDEQPPVQLELPSAGGSREDPGHADEEEGHGDDGH